MANNVLITPGTGDTVAAEDITSVKYQKIKLVDGTAASTTVIKAGGGVEADALRVTVASDSTGVLSVDDNDGALTVDGTVTANLSATDNAVLDAIQVGTDKIIAAPATSAKQDTGNTSVGNIDTNAGATTDAVVAAGAAGSVSAKLRRLTTDVGTLAANLPAQGQALAAASTPVVLTAAQMTTLTPVSAVTATLATETTKVIGTVNISAAQTVAAVTAITNALPAGTNAIGKLAANSGVDIGDVDVTSIPGVVGTIADDATTPGAPVMIGGQAKETDGTDPGSVSAEDDVVRAIFDRNRRQLVNGRHPNSSSANTTETTAQTDKELIAAPGANLSIYITDIIVSNGATAGTVLFEEDTATAKTVKVAKLYLAINGGMSTNFHGAMRCTPNKNFGFTSATVTTHTITVNYYVAP